MPRPDPLAVWTRTVATQLPQLSRPQITVLAAWSLALILTQSCGQTSAAVFLAALWGQSENTVRQRLREWTYERAAKKGAPRQELAVATCFAPLLNWVLTYWPAAQSHLALVLDATSLRDQWTVLTIAVVYRNCAIPIAWKIVPATHKGAWRPHWCTLLATLDRVLPPSWTVVVLTDRGLYAHWLFQAIRQRGWHPFMRINRQGLFRLADQARWRDLHTVTPRPGTQWKGAITCFKNAPGQLRCTLLARWEAEQREPWLVVTDLAPDTAECAWYGLRWGIECGFKDIKRGGWHWEQTKGTDPARVERQWLVLAVATLWVVTVGGAADGELADAAEVAAERADARAAEPVLISGLEYVSEWEPPRLVRQRGPRARWLSCFRRGVILILVGALQGQVPEEATFWPEAWPQRRHSPPLETTVLAPDAALEASVA